MIASADEMQSGSRLEADLCVVGAGPAGIMVALHAAAAGAQVVLLESGGLRPDRGSQALCRGEVADAALHPPADTYRRRGLGGSSTIWGGRCVPLDPIDFAPRPWLNLPSGWPISYATVLPFWRRAHAPAELGRFDYAASTALPGGMRPMFQGFASRVISTESIERFSRPTDFGAEYAARLTRDHRIRVLLHATCVNIALAPVLRAVAHLEIATRAGARLIVCARAYVLAAGGLEVPRLLLASRSQLPDGVGNTRGMVGRHYMSHIAGALGRFMPRAGYMPWHGYERGEDGVYCRRRLAVEPWAQQAHNIGNVVARLHHLPPGDPAHRTGALSAIYLARRMLPYEYRRRLTGQLDRAAVWPHVRNIVGDPWGTTKFALQVLRYRRLAPRKYPSVAVVPRTGVFALDVHAEQLPNPASRITLAREPDRFGVPGLRIDWRYTPQDINTVRVTMGLVAEALSAGGQGRLSFDPLTLESDLRREGAYGGHHLGTARMSESPRTGVVDANCKVHGLENLYVAGGAVFATSGQANPTLTILALALRLADLLVSRLSDGAVSVGDAAPRAAIMRV